MLNYINRTKDNATKKFDIYLRTNFFAQPKTFIFFNYKRYKITFIYKLLRILTSELV